MLHVCKKFMTSRIPCRPSRNESSYLVDSLAQASALAWAVPGREWGTGWLVPFDCLQGKVKADSGVQFSHEVGWHLPQVLPDAADGNTRDQFRLRFAVQVQPGSLGGEQQLKIVEGFQVAGERNDGHGIRFGVGDIVGDDHSGAFEVRFACAGGAEMGQKNVAAPDESYSHSLPSLGSSPSVLPSRKRARSGSFSRASAVYCSASSCSLRA